MVKKWHCCSELQKQYGQISTQLFHDGRPQATEKNVISIIQWAVANISMVFVNFIDFFPLADQKSSSFSLYEGHVGGSSHMTHNPSPFSYGHAVHTSCAHTSQRNSLRFWFGLC